MSDSVASRRVPRSSRQSAAAILVVAVLIGSLAACDRAADAGSPSHPLPSATHSLAPVASTTPAPSSVVVPSEPTGLQWVEGGQPGIATAPDPAIDVEFSVFGWSKGYLGFTGTFVKASGKMQRVLVTTSTDGLTWHPSGGLELGGDDPILVSQVVEGPGGLLATAEIIGCAYHKAATRMWRSSDGVSWTRVDLGDVFGAEALPSVSGGSAGFIVLAATGDHRTVWTSRDGDAWHKRALPGALFRPQSVASFRDGFILAGSTVNGPLDCGATTGDTTPHGVGSAWSSPNGAGWVEAALPGALTGTDTVMNVERLGDGAVLIEDVVTLKNAYDRDARVDWTSMDGVTWLPSDTLAFSTGIPVTDGARTVFIHGTDQGEAPVIRVLAPDLSVLNLPAGTVNQPDLDILAAVGPTGFLVTDESGATSFLAALDR
jgi:hypothetical protein